MTMLLGTGIGLTTSRRGSSGGPAPTFTPAAMFAAGETGAWYDPSDRSTMFQDTAMTIPVTAHNQPVGVMRDKSGNGIHLIAPNDGARPVYQETGNRQRLAFFDEEKMLVSSNTFLTRTEDDSVYLAAATDNTSLSKSWCPIAVGDGVTRAGTDNRFAISYFTSVGSATNYISELRDASSLSYRMNKIATADDQTHYEDFYVPAGAQPSSPPVTVSSQIDGQALSQSANDGPDPIVASMKVGLGTFNFSTPAANDINYWYGGIVVLRSMTQSDRDKLRIFFSTSH